MGCVVGNPADRVNTDSSLLVVLVRDSSLLVVLVRARLAAGGRGRPSSRS